MINLSGKAAIVTGAGQGIGRGIALALATHGADVAVCDINRESAEKVAGEIEKLGGKSVALKVDVSKEEDTTQMAEATVAAFSKIDILCNNAGIISMHYIRDLTVQEWDRMFAVNTRGVFLGTQAVIGQMMKQGAGRIINTASQAGKTAWPLIAHYCASKAAVISFTKACALEFAPTVLVNAICPGSVDTDMSAAEAVWASEIHKIDRETIRRGWIDAIPLKRLAQPEDIARVAVFLASEYASYMTGQAINVTGGQTMY